MNNDNRPKSVPIRKNPDWAIPEGLTEDGLKAARMIRAVAADFRLKYTGGCKVFRTPAEHQATGARYGLGSQLVVCHDGGAVQRLDSDPDVRKRLDTELAKCGLYLEGCTAAYSAVYLIWSPPKLAPSALVLDTAHFLGGELTVREDTRVIEGLPGGLVALQIGRGNTVFFDQTGARRLPAGLAAFASVPYFDSAELAVLCDAISQFCENREDEEPVSVAARSAEKKLNAWRAGHAR